MRQTDPAVLRNPDSRAVWPAREHPVADLEKLGLLDRRTVAIRKYGCNAAHDAFSSETTLMKTLSWT